MLDHSYMSKCHIRAWGICAAAFLTTTVLASGTATAATSYAATTRQNMGSAVNLVIYNGDPPASQYFNNINAVFEKAHHVTITSVYYPLDTFLTNFEAAVAGHANINILMDPGRDIAFLQQQGDLVPVTGLIPTSRFRPSMLTPYVHDNKLWAYPVGNVDATGVIYNLALLDKFHLSPPTTFAQVIAAGKILAQRLQCSGRRGRQRHPVGPLVHADSGAGFTRQPGKSGGFPGVDRHTFLVKPDICGCHERYI